MKCPQKIALVQFLKNCPKGRPFFLYFVDGTWKYTSLWLFICIYIFSLLLSLSLSIFSSKHQWKSENREEKLNEWILYIWQRRDKRVQEAKENVSLACLARRIVSTRTCGSKATCRWWRNLKLVVNVSQIRWTLPPVWSIHSVAVRWSNIGVEIGPCMHAAALKVRLTSPSGLRPPSD